MTKNGRTFSFHLIAVFLFSGILSGCETESLLLSPVLSSGENSGPEFTPSPSPLPTAPPASDVSLRAAETTAATHPSCTKLGDFYWEVGDGSGTLGSGTVGSSYGSSTPLQIASASKIVFGAYLVEATRGHLSLYQKDVLRMLSGYHGLNPVICGASPTLADCLNAGRPGPNYTYSNEEVGRFHYDGAHDEHFADLSASEGGLGFGGASAADLNSLLSSTFGFSIGFGYAFPELAGGITASAAQFAGFLQAIVAGRLLLRDHLGEEAVCTLPGVCATAVSSPSPVNWHYSYNHWVEDDGSSDGAFSSPGAFGFYPWISADKKLYGILSRKVMGGGFDSARCGYQIRKAWISGLAQ